MANASTKKIAASNVRILDNLRKGFAVVHLFYILYRIIYRWSTFNTAQLALYVTTTGVSMFMYSALETNGRPKYDPAGNVISSGDDLNAEGVTAYMFDIIYIVWFSQVMSVLVSEKFWFTFLVIPAYALYKVLPTAWKLFISGQTGVGEYNPPAKSKRQEKLEKKASKGHVQYVKKSN